MYILFSVSAITCGEGCVERMCCKSNIVVYMPLVLSVRVVIGGWVYVGGVNAPGGDEWV